MVPDDALDTGESQPRSTCFCCIKRLEYLGDDLFIDTLPAILYDNINLTVAHSCGNPDRISGKGRVRGPV